MGACRLIVLMFKRAVFNGFGGQRSRLCPKSIRRAEVDDPNSLIGRLGQDLTCWNGVEEIKGKHRRRKGSTASFTGGIGNETVMLMAIPVNDHDAD